MNEMRDAQAYNVWPLYKDQLNLAPQQTNAVVVGIQPMTTPVDMLGKRAPSLP